MKELLGHSKDKHGLTVSDLNPMDKMKFSPTEKIIKDALISFMEENVSGCDGTATIFAMHATC